MTSHFKELDQGIAKLSQNLFEKIVFEKYTMKKVDKELKVGIKENFNVFFKNVKPLYLECIEEMVLNNEEHLINSKGYDVKELEKKLAELKKISEEEKKEKEDEIDELSEIAGIILVNGERHFKNYKSELNKVQKSMVNRMLKTLLDATKNLNEEMKEKIKGE